MQMTVNERIISLNLMRYQNSNPALTKGLFTAKLINKKDNNAKEEKKNAEKNKE